MTKKYFPIVMILFLAVGGFFIFSNKKPSQKEEVQGTTSEVQEISPVNKPTESEATMSGLQIDANKIYTAVLKTSEGDITIQLNAKQTPVTVSNFVSLAKKNFYNGTVFHRDINLTMNRLKENIRKERLLWPIAVPTPTVASFLSCMPIMLCRKIM